jgi:hypothetical protein
LVPPERTELLRELGRELVELAAAGLDELELALEDPDRRRDDLRALLVAVDAGPAVAERRPRPPPLGERGQLLERLAERVAKADELGQPADVRVGVRAPPRRSPCSRAAGVSSCSRRPRPERSPGRARRE